MNQLTTLIFPDTLTDPEKTANLLLFFEKIYYYQPAEPLGPPALNPKSITGLFAGEGLCHGYVPFPLGEDLGRFYKSLRDIQTNLEDYGHRIPYLSLASLTSGQSLDETESSIGSLVSELKKTYKSKEHDTLGDITASNVMWQARLVLKLAELLDLEEKEVTQGLANIAKRELDIFTSLKGDEGDSSLEKISPPLSEQIQYPSSALGQRMRAWARLFMAEQRKNQPQEKHWLLTTSREDAFTVIQNSYTDLFKKQPVLLFTLPLPSLNGLDFNTIMNKRTSIRTELSNTLATVKEFLSGVASNKKQYPLIDGGTGLLAKETAEWREAIRQICPGDKTAKSGLAFYFFPGISLPDLLASTCQLAETGEASSTEYPNGLIAVLAARPHEAHWDSI